MRRFYLPPEQIQPETLVLTGGEAHHAAAVLRVRPDDLVCVLDGAGREFTCRVTGVEKKHVRLRVEQTSAAPPPPSRLTLFQAIPKGKIFESIIEKATELGVWAIVPLLSERVALRLEGEAAEHKAEKWRQTAVEAIKQCGQRWLPRVEEPQTVEAALRSNFDLTLVGALRGEARHPRECFEAFAHARRPPPGSIAIWIGPEGDFSPAELDRIIEAGAAPISLGPLVLRSETAAAYALSIVNYELQWAAVKSASGRAK